ncbi:MAG: hypothetical protein METHSR3v1_2240001, partial [Methanothrix sp.]
MRLEREWKICPTKDCAPFSDIARYALGPNASAIISIMALFATTNTV